MRLSEKIADKILQGEGYYIVTKLLDGEDYVIIDELRGMNNEIINGFLDAIEEERKCLPTRKADVTWLRKLNI